MKATRAGPVLGWWRVATTGTLLAGAAVVVVTMLVSYPVDGLGWDFREAYLPAAESVRAGDSPYPPPRSTVIDEERAYLYPPQLAIVLVPLTALPVDAAAILALFACLAALVGALNVVGVRDVRCYAALLLWAPAWNALEMANVSAILALAVALVWRFRATLWPLAAALGLAVSAKLFLWPLVVWALVTRRLRVAVLAVAVGLAVTFAAWAAIGFDGLIDYLELLTKVHEEGSYSLVGISEELGYGAVVGHVVMVIVGGALLGGCANAGWNRDEFRAFTYAVAASLALTPVIWQHYLVLLAVPLAVARPRFSAVWLLPIALWVSPRVGNGDGLETLLPALVAFALLFILLAPTRGKAIAAGAPA